ncbi:hypothetical protein FRC15_010864 [Serendipita sp. 397]|nr:hypothetical protein FRC15_010864 [Serendipita sp. 397]
MLAVVHRHFLGPSVTRRFGEENLNAIRAHIVALQSSPPAYLSRLESRRPEAKAEIDEQIAEILQDTAMRGTPV